MSKFFDGLSKKIRIFNVQTMNISNKHRLFFCLVLGVVTGTLLMNFFGAKSDDIRIYSSFYASSMEDINNGIIDKFDFFIYCLKKYFLEICIIFVIGYTAIWKSFFNLYCIYKGIVIGVLVSALTISYGTGGILLFMVSIFPHYITYVPCIILALYMAIKMRERKGTKASFLLYAKVIGFTFALGLLTAMIEAYGNYPLINAVYN